MSQNYFTPFVDGTDPLDADTLNGKLGELDSQITTNTNDIAAIDSYPGSGTTLKADVDASNVDADTVDGLDASDLKGDDLSIPARHSMWPNTNKWTATGYGWTKGICIDRLGHVWVGLMDSSLNAKVAKFEDHRVQTPTVLDLGVSNYKVVDLVATNDAVFALLAYNTVDGWGSSVTAPAQVGKIAKIDIDTGTLDTSWGTNGVYTFPSGYTDPWCMVSDDTYLWVGLLKSPGEVARVTISSPAITSWAANTGNDYVTAIALAQTGITSYNIVVGFHTYTSTEGRLAYMTTGGSYTYYKLTSGDDDHQFIDMVNSGGIMIASVAQRTSGEKVCYWNAGNPDPDSDGYVTPSYISKLVSYAGTYSSDPKVAIGVDGSVYVAAGGASEHVGKFSSVVTGSIEELVNISLGSSHRAYDALHDGRNLWICGTDPGSGTAFVLQLGL